MYTKNKKRKDRIIDDIYKSWKGAAIGALVAAIFYFLFVYGVYVQLGFGSLPDALIIIIGFVFLLGLLGLFFKIIFQIVRNFNPWFIAAIAAIGSLAFFSSYQFIAILFIFCGVLYGGILGYTFTGKIKKRSAISLLMLTIVLIIGSLYFLLYHGVDRSIPFSESYWQQPYEKVQLSDPSTLGNYPVKTLYYGSGNDKNRSEYRENVSIITNTVDATLFFNQTRGMGNAIRRSYWGFDASNYPINGRVWYPDGNGTLPLVLIVHGNHNMSDFSDGGYQYLGELLASRGYIVASIDENFLNKTWFGDYNNAEIFTRGWMILKHLQNWREWNQTINSPFYGKIDMSNIAIIGHSRGGNAAALAPILNKYKKYYGNANHEFNFDFSIKSIALIAPSDSYELEKGKTIDPENVDLLLLHGGHDQDVHFFIGSRIYNRTKFTDGNYHFKSSLYIYRANHGQFNTDWGRVDTKRPASWMLNLKPIILEEEQRKIAQIYISAFLDASIKGKKEYIKLLKDYRQGYDLLPDDYYINQFEDTSCKYIADFEEDLDVTTASLNGCFINGENLSEWYEDVLSYKDKTSMSQQTSAAFLAWDNKDNKIASYSVRLDEKARDQIISDSIQSLFFSIFNKSLESDSVDFTIELISGDSIVRKPFSLFCKLPPRLEQKLTKCSRIYTLGKDIVPEQVLQYVELPFAEFRKDNATFEPEKLTEIRFIFDQMDIGKIVIDGIGVR